MKKQNKLEKETLKEKFTSLIPGAIIFQKNFTKKYANKSIGRNAIITVFGLPLIGGYIFASLSYGAPTFSKEWFQNKKEHDKNIKQQELIHQQNAYRKEFQQLDQNKDYVIDSTEFIYR